jgi:hypothetical protein
VKIVTSWGDGRYIYRVELKSAEENAEEFWPRKLWINLSLFLWLLRVPE